VSLARAFLAVRPPDEVVAALRCVRDDPVWPPCRRTPTDQLHITIAFLGRVPDAAELIPALDRPRTPEGASPAGWRPLAVRFWGLGAFPSARRAQVCWAGVEDASALVSLHSVVSRRIAGLAEYRSDRPYRPHLTLARFRRPADIRPELEVMRGEPVGPTWFPHELVLFESTTHADGARHRPVARFDLVAGRPA